MSAMASAMPSASARLAVTRLMLTDFRGYAAARLAVDERPVVLTGPNGAGKTNLLEAISFLAPGRGIRRAKLAEIDRRVPPAKASDAAPGAWTVAATVTTPRGPVQIGTGRDAASDSGERRLVRVDGAPAKSQAALAEHVTLVWLTPQMDRLFVEGSAPRRRFLDRLVYGFDPAHAARVGAYEQAMRERARLLRHGPADPVWLVALEHRMAEQGVAVAAARRDVTARLDAVCRRARGPFPGAELALTGEVEDWLGAMPALAAEQELGRRLAAARRVDGDSGATTVGPHRRAPCRHGHGGGALLDRRAEGAADRRAAGAGAAPSGAARHRAGDAVGRGNGASGRRAPGSAFPGDRRAGPPGLARRHRARSFCRARGICTVF
jgi:DNA replication and repair protein RecF